MKNKYIAKHLWKDKTTAMSGADVVAASFNDCINLSLGDPDFTTDQRIIDAAFKDASNGYTKYPNFQGDPELRQEIINFYKEEYGVELEDSEVLVRHRVLLRCISLWQLSSIKATRSSFRDHFSAHIHSRLN